MREGTTGASAFVVMTGMCQAFRTLGGKRELLGEIGPGEAFGELAMVSDRARTTSVMAMTEVTLKVVTAEALERELARSSWLRVVIAALADRARATTTINSKK